MEWLLLAAGLLLIAGTGFFVAVEFSLIALDQPTVQRAIDDGDTGAAPGGCRNGGLSAVAQHAGMTSFPAIFRDPGVTS